MLKKLIGFCVALTLLLIALVAAIPMLLSSSWGTSLITSQVNKAIPGKLEVQKFNINWLGGQEIDQVTLYGTNGEQIISIDKISADGSLFALINDALSSGNLKVNGLKGTIIQDQSGATNLEDAFGVKTLSKDSLTLKTPVAIENVNLEIKKGSDDSIVIKGVGLTRQNDVKGQFSFNASWGEKQSINLRAQHFPVLVLDQTLAMKNPKLSGLFTGLVGEYFDITIDQTGSGTDHTIQILAKSPHISSDIKASIDQKTIQTLQGSKIDFNVAPEAIKALVAQLDLKQVPLPLQPLQGSVLLNQFTLPVNQKDVQLIAGKIELNVKANEFQFDPKQPNISLQNLKLTAEAFKEQPKLQVKLEGSGSQANQPLSIDIQVEAEKADLLADSVAPLLRSGLVMNGHVKADLAPLAPLFGTGLQFSWKGLIKEENSTMTIALNSEKINIPEIHLTLAYLPLQELLEEGAVASDVSGVIALKKPEFVGVADTPLAAIEEVTIPWNFDVDNNAMRISFAGRPAGTDETIKGTVRLDRILSDSGIDLEQSGCQADVKLIGFDTKSLQTLLPEHNIAAVFGPMVDADIKGSRDSSGNINGTLELNTPKGSDAFLKSFAGKFALQNNNRDITFNASTQQKIGKTQFAGTFHDLFDDKKNLHLDQAAISLQGHLQHFPVGLIVQMTTGNKNLAEKMEAILGTQVNADIAAEIKNRNGPLTATIKGLNGELDLNGRVENGIFLLSNPLTASVKVTPQLEQLVLRDYLPILGSAISADKPLTLVIEPDNFSVPLQNPTMNTVTVGNARLELDKMQFSRNGQLGKVVQFLGISSNVFDVWFTPIYFSLNEGLLTLYRTDMLIANTYPLANWGTVDFQTNQLRLFIGLTGRAIRSAFNVKGLKESYMLPIPVKGPIRKPQVDIAKVSPQISALIAKSQGSTEGKLLGTFLDIASNVVTDEQGIPEPTTSPLPWADSLPKEEPDTETKIIDAPAEILDQPIKDIKKGAKNLLKGIFGK